MQVRESLAMDQSGTTFSSRKTYTISRFTLIFLAAIFVCSIVAVGLLIYNFATCPEISVQSQVCESSHVIPLINGDDRASHSTSKDTNTSSHANDDILNLRLPRSVVPIRYDIKLIPFLFSNNFTFNGEVKIDVNVTENCKNITLHATALKIRDDDVRVRRSTVNGSTEQSPPLEIKSQYFVDARQFYVIEFNDMLQNGSHYTVEIKYTGILNDLLQGFYRSSYNIGNESR